MKININGKMIEVDNEALKSAIESESETFELKNDDLVIRSIDEDETFKTNITNQSQAVGIEIGRKNLLKGLGIETEGGVHKDDTKALETLNNFISSKVSSELESAKIEPNKKVQELTKDIDILKQNLSNIQKEKEEVLNQFTGYKKQQSIHNALSSSIPDNITLPKDDMLLLLSNKIKTDVNENGQVFAIGPDGQPIKNPTTLEVKPINEVVTDFFNQNKAYLKGSSGGAGGSDSSGSKGSQKNLETFIAEMREKGIAPNSPQFNNELKKQQEAGLLDLS